jgi:hypothetical protein
MRARNAARPSMLSRSASAARAIRPAVKRALEDSRSFARVISFKSHTLMFRGVGPNNNDRKLLLGDRAPENFLSLPVDVG